MAIAVKVRQGGGAAAATTDFASQIQMVDGPWAFSVGMQFDTRGGAAISQFTIEDDDNQIYTAGTHQIEAHNRVTVTENASGTERILHLGRVAAGNAGRGLVEHGVARVHHVDSEDANVDLDGITLTSPWARGVETGTERLLAAGAAFLTGGVYRTTTDITVARWDALGTGHLVKPHPTAGEASMPAKTYPAGTRITEIIADCAETEGQAWGVVLHDDASGTHACLQYCEEDDWDVNPSPLAITDTNPDLSTSFPPIWDNGPAMVREGQEVATGFVVKWGTGDDSFLVQENPALIDRFDRWILPYNDSRAQTASAAAARAPHLLAGHDQEHVSHALTIKLPASKAHLVRAGMSITIRSAAARHTEALGGTATRRIGQVMLELDAPEAGGVEAQYLAHLQLARPQKIARTRPGSGSLKPKAPTPPSSSAADLFGTTLTWSETGICATDYCQTIPQFMINGSVQAEHVISNGYNHSTAAFRTPPAGAGVPDPGKYFPCTAGVPITLDMDVRYQGSPGSSASVGVLWYDSSFGLISTSTVFPEQALSGFVHVSETLTPPAGAVAWRLSGKGLWDNIAASSGGTTDSDPSGLDEDEIGTDTGHHSNATHNHHHGKLLSLNTPSDHPFFTEHAAQIGAHLPSNYAATAAPTATDDTTEGYVVGSRWIDVTNDNSYTAVDVTAGAAVWVQTNGAGGSHPDLAAHDTLGLATQVELDAHAADTGLHGGGGGGGGVSWEQKVNESGASLAGWLVGTGTWSSDGAIISQTSTAASHQRMRYDSKVPQGFGVVHEAEIRFPTAGAGTGSIRRGGLLLVGNALAGNALTVYLAESNAQIGIDRDAGLAITTIAATINKDTWYKLRAVLNGGIVTIYLNGVEMGTVNLMGSGGWTRLADFVGVHTYGTLVNFRNVKTWTLSSGAPA